MATTATIPVRVEHAMERAGTLLGRRFDKAEIAKVIRGSLSCDPDVRLEVLLAGVGLTPEHPESADVVHAYGELTLDLLMPCKGASEVVEELAARFALAVITNTGDENLQQTKLRRCGLASLVPYLIASSTFGSRKPDRRIFQHACDQAGVPANRAVHVGDSPIGDVAGALGAGMHAVLVNTHIAHPPSEARACAEIDQLSELPPILRQLNCL